LDSTTKKRLKIVVYLFLALMAIFILRLYFLQVISGSLYAEEASESIVRTRTILAPRGNIYDKNGKLLVKSVPVLAVAVDPRVVLQHEDVIKVLSEKLNIPYEDIVKKLQNSNIPYLDRVILKENIDYGSMIYLKENSNMLPGVGVIDIFSREYSYGSLASHILGYTGEINEDKLKMKKYSAGYEGGDQIGLTGIEAVYENVLKGVKGEIIYEVDPMGRPVRIIEETSYTAGNDLYLTIDIELQKKVEEILHESVVEIRQNKLPRSDEYYKVTGGAVIVLGARTGEVLAMASYPTFNPELFVGGISVSDWNYLNNPDNSYPLNNRAMMSFAPGSAFKVIPAYAGLSENIVSEYSKINCSGVWYRLGEDFPKWCWKKTGHGSIDIRSAIKNSCDIYFYEIGYGLFLKLQNIEELLQKYARIFGFGAKTGIDLPYEDGGLVPDRQWKKEYFKNQVENSVWYPGDTINMVIGQGYLLATPLQTAQAYSILANRGIKHTPYVVSETRDESGEISIDLSRNESENLNLNSNFMSIIEEGLCLAVSQGTASYAFRNFPLSEIPIAGKTGTSEVAGKQDYAWFASYGPVGNPEYVVVVMLEEAGSGGKVAAPVAEKIYRYLFNLN